jgi:hypothetical protein
MLNVVIFIRFFVHTWWYDHLTSKVGEFGQKQNMDRVVVSQGTHLSLLFLSLNLSVFRFMWSPGATGHLTTGAGRGSTTSCTEYLQCRVCWRTFLMSRRGWEIVLIIETTRQVVCFVFAPHQMKILNFLPYFWDLLLFKKLFVLCPTRALLRRCAQLVVQLWRSVLSASRGESELRPLHEDIWRQPGGHSDVCLCVNYALMSHLGIRIDVLLNVSRSPCI